jgi:hypothetical protein
MAEPRCAGTDGISRQPQGCVPERTLPSVLAIDAHRHAGPLDRCKVIELAGRAVGASFVGVLAAGLGFNEVLHRLVGAPEEPF